MTQTDADKNQMKIREDQRNPRHQRSMVFFALACAGWQYINSKNIVRIKQKNIKIFCAILL